MVHTRIDTNEKKSCIYYFKEAEPLFNNYLRSKLGFGRTVMNCAEDREKVNAPAIRQALSGRRRKLNQIRLVGP